MLTCRMIIVIVCSSISVTNGYAITNPTFVIIIIINSIEIQYPIIIIVEYGENELSILLEVSSELKHHNDEQNVHH